MDDLVVVDTVVLGLALCASLHDVSHQEHWTVVVDRVEVDMVVPDGVVDILLVGCFELIIASSRADVVFSEIVISVVSGRVTTVDGSADTHIA